MCGIPGPPEVGGGGPGGGRRRLARRPAPTARPSAGSALRPGEEEGAGASAARTRPLAFPSGRRAARGGGAAAAGSVCASRPRSSQTLGEHGGGGAGGPGAPRRRRRGRGGAVGHGPRAFLLLGLCAARDRAARRGLRAPHPEVPQPVRRPDRHAPQIRGAALRGGVGPVRGPAQGLRGERALQGAPRAAADPGGSRGRAARPAAPGPRASPSPPRSSGAPRRPAPRASPTGKGRAGVASLVNGPAPAPVRR